MLSYLMSRRIFDRCGVMKPIDHRNWICLNSAFKQEPFTIIFLSDCWFLRKSWCNTIDLSVLNKFIISFPS